jgi:hypothetical protein
MYIHTYIIGLDSDRTSLAVSQENRHSTGCVLPGIGSTNQPRPQRRSEIGRLQCDEAPIKAGGAYEKFLSIDVIDIAYTFSNY